MTSYTTLIDGRTVDGAIKNWVNDDRIGPVTIIEEAEQWIYEQLRVRDMLTYQTGTMTIGAGGASLAITNPYRFKAPYHFQITGATQDIGPSEVKKKGLDIVRNAFSWDNAGVRSEGRPIIYALDASNIVFNSAPDKAYPYNFAHYARLDPLATSINNFLTEKYPKLLRHVCMFTAFEHLRRPDERRYHLELASALAQSANRDSDMAMETEEITVENV